MCVARGIDSAPSLLQAVAEREAFEQLHDDEAVAVGRLPEVLHVDDVLVADLRDRARLVEEARDHLLVPGQLGMDDLERDAFADDRVVREEHVAHRAGADLLQHLVVADGGADANHVEIIALLRDVSQLDGGVDEFGAAEDDGGGNARLVVEDGEAVRRALFHDVQIAGVHLDACRLL